MSVGFSCSTGRVQESKMLTVETAEERLGDDDGHVVAVALDVNPWSWNKIFFLEMGKNKLKIYSPTLSLFDGRELSFYLLTCHGMG